MDKESDFYARFVRPKLKDWGDHCRVENSAESGTPDISYAICGVQGWIETKLVREDALHFSVFQLPWMQKRLRHAKGNLWLFATDFQALYIYSAEQLLKAKKERVGKWIKMMIYDIEPPLVYSPHPPWEWGRVLLLLTRDKRIE